MHMIILTEIICEENIVNNKEAKIVLVSPGFCSATEGTKSLVGAVNIQTFAVCSVLVPKYYSVL